MARKVFFSFHYQNDIFRVNVVRNHFLTKGRYLDAGYFDYSLWETAKSKSPQNLKRMIDDGLEGTTVTAILIGGETANRPWVKYEIEQSIKRGNGLLGIYIHNVPCAKIQVRSNIGQNPLDSYNCPALNYRFTLLQKCSQAYPSYDWIHHDGYNNFQTWVETAAQIAGK
jgi:MTH538 TIR-like domain (DUF1863)